MTDVLNLPRPAWMSEDVALLDETTRRFIAAEYAPHLDKWHDDHFYPREVWTKAGAAGLLCASMPEDYGGAGGTFAHEAVIDRQFALAGFDTFGAPLHSGIVAPYILHYGTEEQKKRWLPKLATGELIGAIAMSEPAAGSDLRGIRTTARRDGDEYVLNGQKTYITNGQTANLIAVVAKTSDGEAPSKPSIIFVETDHVQGFSRGRNLEKVGMDLADTSELFFSDVRVPVANLLGTEGSGMHQLMAQLPQERLIIAVQGIAAAERALALTIDYVKQRRAFGQALIEFQNTQFKLAECKTEVTIGRVFVDHCLDRHLRGQLDSATASMAKYWVTDLQCRVIDECLQLHGGAGYMLEYPIAQMYRDARAQRIYGGTNEIMKVLIARGL